MKSVLEKCDIKVLLGEGICTKENIGEKTIIMFRWDRHYNDEDKKIMCGNISFFIGQEDILVNSIPPVISENDIDIRAVEHLSLLVDYCVENKISFYDCTVGEIEELLDRVSFSPLVDERTTQKIENFLSKSQ